MNDYPRGCGKCGKPKCERCLNASSKEYCFFCGRKFRLDENIKICDEFGVWCCESCFDSHDHGWTLGEGYINKMSAPEAEWITRLRREILGDTLGKLEVIERELERQSRRLDMNAQTSAVAWEQLEKRVIRCEDATHLDFQKITSLASDLENLEKRVKRIEDEFST